MSPSQPVNPSCPFESDHSCFNHLYIRIYHTYNDKVL